MSFLFKLFIYFQILFQIYCQSQSCHKENSECNSSTHNIYSKEVNSKYLKYIKLLEDAQKNYIPCDSTKCNCHSSVIKEDLKPYSKGISKNQIDSVRKQGTKYQIIDGQLYREKNCLFPARCSGIEYFLLKLLPKLPDMELIINTRDWPQFHKRFGSKHGPVFSFSKTNDYYDVMYPAWAFWEGGPAISLYPRGIGRWDNHRLTLGKIGNDTAWKDKIPRAFFRGSRTSEERDPIVLLSREEPDLVDAQYTKNQAWKSDADTLHQPPAKEVTFEEHCKYKYLFNFRGVAASFRFKHILLCKSLVFHVGNEWLEFFYPALKPWIHYIPVDANANKAEIKELIEFAIDNDEIVRKIAENGYNMIWTNLKMSDVTCYWRKLLKKYASLLDFKPTIDVDLIKIN